MKTNQAIQGMPNITQIPIKQKFDTVLEALDASGMDISYNPTLARIQAARLEQDNRVHFAARNITLGEDGKIRFTVLCADGVETLNTFSPFFDAIDDSPLRFCIIRDHEILIFEDLTISKADRKHMARVTAEQGIIFA